MIKLYPLKVIYFPVIAECINPNIFDGKTREEIKDLEIWEGNKKIRLGELFAVDVVKDAVKPRHTVITLEGDLSKVRRIGVYMNGGEIIIRGNVGMHLGEELKAGRIVVYGNVEGWAGSMMKGGEIEIHGNASDYLGAPYRGCDEGMRGGKITVFGDVGNEAGANMRKGIIRIYGNVGQFVGFRMRGGTIYIQKDAEVRAGACMTGGKIVVGGFLEHVLPTFTIDSIKKKVKIEGDEIVRGPFYRFLGDIVENGDGKLFVSKEKNPKLGHYEKFL
jgi:formylmethanofuran dehydrogenase subunit C